jgi:polysaccharide pyruvyl transferase WcaK-like protein
VPRVLLAGAFGQRNPGDESLLAAFASALPGWTALVPTRDPALLPRSGNVLPTGAAAPDVAHALRGAHAVILAGGTVFKLLPPETGRGRHDLLLRSLARSAAARAAGRTVAAVGVGAGHLHGARATALTRAIATNLDMLVVRDTRSADTLAHAGLRTPLRVGADAAWTLFSNDESPLPEPSPARPGPLVITMSRHAGGPAQIPRLAAAVATVARVRDEVTGVDVEPWQVGGFGPDDLDLARSMARALTVAGAGNVRISLPPVDVRDAAARYRDTCLVIGQRFHSLVAAGAAGCRFLAVAHEQKLAGLADRLGQQALPVDGPVSSYITALLAALDGPGPDRDAVEQERAAASATLGLLRTLLEHGRPGTLPEADLRCLHMHPAALVR